MFSDCRFKGFVILIAVLLLFSSTGFCLSRQFDGNKKVDQKVFDEMENEIAGIISKKGEKAYDETLIRVVIHLADEEEPLLSEVGMAMMDMVKENVSRKQKDFLNKVSESEFQLALNLTLQYSVAGYVSYNGLQKLAGLPEVKAIDFDNLNKPFTTQGRQLMNIDWVASNLGYTGSGIAVGMIDSAFDYKHAEFGGYSTYPNAIVVDGYNFSNNSTNIYPADWDDGYHGTGTAGIIRRVAPGAKLVLATVFPNAYDSVIANAINYMVQKQSEHNIRVINLSLGSGGYSSICSNSTIGGAMNNAVAAGIIPVAASGNDGYTNRISMPACLSNVISVGSVFDVANANYTPFYPAYCSQSLRRQDERTCYSNAASILDIYAPSEEVITAQVFGGTFALGGTSSASPYAAAAIAVLLEAVPSLSGDVNAVRSLLAQTGASVIEDLGYGQKRIDLKAAIEDSGGTSGCQGTEQEFASSDVPKSIPDNNTSGVNSVLNISAGGTIASLKITMNISHTYRGDLKLKLRSPSGTEVLFYDPASNDSADNIVGYIDIADFNGQPMNGTWTFNVSDHASQDTGTINSWSLTICYDPAQTDPPEINSFYASPGTITQGSSSRLYWSVSNSTGIEIVGVGTYTSSSGSVAVTPSSTRSYTLKATGPGGQAQATTTVTVESSGGCTPQSFSFSSSDVPKSIPDYNTSGISSYLTVPPDITEISNFTVTVNISHTYKGDLIVKLFSPSGKELVIHNRAGGSADNVTGTFSTTAFNGDTASGQWRLFASDNARYDTGSINSWNIDFSACGESASPPPPSEDDIFQSADTPINIPDNNSSGITSLINVTRSSSANTVIISVNISHTYTGDLTVTLMTPAGDVILHNREGGSADNIIKSYQVNYNGNNPYGQWKLNVKDLASYDTGKLNSWSVQF